LQRATKFELMINLRTAAAGFEVSTMLLVRADEVID